MSVFSYARRGVLAIVLAAAAAATALAQTPLAPPVGLSADVAGSAVTLRWLPPLVLPASFVVEAGSAPGLSDLGTIAAGGTTLSVGVAAVPQGNYFVRVRAAGGAAASAPSNEIIVTVGAACQLPPAPTALTTSIAAALLTVQWNGSGGAFRLEAGSGHGRADVFSGDVGSVTSFSGTVPAGAYFVRVRERNACGFGPASPDAVASVGVPASPVNFRASTIGAAITFRWDGPGNSGPLPTGYALEAGSAPGLRDVAVVPLAGSALLFTAPGVASGIYYVRLRASDGAGSSAPSDELAVIVGPTPSHLSAVTFDSLAPNGPAFTTHTEAGYVVAAIAGPWASGPALISRNTTPLTPLDSELRVTAVAGSPFTLASAKLYSSVTPIPYVLRGVLDGATVYTATGTVPNTFGNFATVPNPFADTLVDAVFITVTNPSTPTCPTCTGNPVGIDDIVLRP